MSNNRLPTYEPSVRLEVAPSVDVQSTAQTLINAFSNFAGAVNTGEQMLAKHVVEGQRGEIRNQIANSYQGFAVNAMQQDDKMKALQGYDQQSQEYAKQYLEQTHFWNKDYARNMLDYFANTHRAPIISATMQQSNRVAAVQSAISQNDMTTQIMDAIENSKPALGEDGVNHQFDSVKSLIADQYKALTRDYVNGHTRMDVVRTTIPSLNKSYNKAMAVRGYKDALEAGHAQQYIKDFLNSSIEGLSDKEKNSIVNGEFKQALGQYYTGLGISLNQLDKQANDMLSNIEKGGQVNSIILDAYSQAKSPEDALDLQKKIVVSQAVSDANKRFATSNPAQIQSEVEKYRPINPDDPNFKYQELMYKKIKNVADTNLKNLYADPMAEIKYDPNVKQTLMDYQNAKQAGATGTNYLNSPLNTEQAHPDYAIAYAQERRGLSLSGPSVGGKDLSVRFFTQPEAATIVASVNAATPRQKLQIFQKLRDESANSSFFNARISQLVKSGMNPQLATAANVDPTSPYAEHIIAALSMPLNGKEGLATMMEQAHKADKKTFDTNVINDVTATSAPGFLRSAVRNTNRNNFSGYMASLSSYAGGRSPEFNEQMASSLKNMGYYAMLNGIAKSPQEALAWAENNIASRYQITSMNGQSIRIPNQYTASTVMAYANEKQDEVKDFPFVTSNATVGVPSGIAASEIDRELIQRGHWANDPLDNGLIWVDFNGKVRVDKDGKPFRISFEQAQNWHESPQHLFRIEDKITNSLLGNKPAQEEDEPKAPLEDKQKLDQTEFKQPAPASSKNLVEEIMNNNIPAFEGLDLPHDEERESRVYDAKARGLRNNNPGNITKTANRYPGEVDGDDRVFKTFKTPEAGIKAMGTLLKKYANRGINTISGLVHRWSATDQAEYTQFVSNKLGISPNEPINLRDKDVRGKVMSAIIEFENGHNPYGESTVMELA